MLDQSLGIARNRLLSPTSLEDAQLASIVDYLRSGSVDAADLYFQAIHDECWSTENGLIKSGQFNIDQGVGIRAISQSQVGFAYSQELSFQALMKAAQAARSSVTAAHSTHQLVGHAARLSINAPRLYKSADPLLSMNDQAKLDLLSPLNGMARQLSHAVVQVNANLQAQHEVVLIVRNDGTFVADVRPMVRMQVSIIVERNGRRESGYAGEAVRADYTRFITENTGEQLVEEAVKSALLNLDAESAPAGTLPVVLGPGFPGVLIHEAVGHGLEADFNRKGSSTFTGKIGEQVASPLCTIVDNGTIPEHCGSLNVDDEGTPTQNTVLIEKGILKQYMQDNLNAKLMNMQSTGNGRRESYMHLPIPRMTNTYLLAGEDEPEAIIASVKDGIYAENFSGGQVDVTGKFVFSTAKAFRIKNGKITKPIKGATLIGNGLDVLKRASMVGNDLKISKTGWCGKEGQTVPVSVGQPTVKIDALTVGGTV